jgi:hypothetical protein
MHGHARGCGATAERSGARRRRRAVARGAGRHWHQLGGGCAPDGGLYERRPIPGACNGTMQLQPLLSLWCCCAVALQALNWNLFLMNRP